MDIPKDHIRWVKYLNEYEVPQYIITSDPGRQYYYLWKVSDNGYEKLGKNKSPQEFINKVESRLRCDEQD